MPSKKRKLKLMKSLSPTAHILSPKQTHQKVMKSSLRKAIELKKLDEQPNLIRYASSLQMKEYLTKDNAGGSIDLSSPINSVINSVGTPFNEKSMKNLQFLPFFHERNGMGKIINCDTEPLLKKSSVPSILQTQKILKKVQIKRDITQIDREESLENNFIYDRVEDFTNYDNSTSSKHYSSQPVIGYKSPINLDNLNNSKFFDDQEKLILSATTTIDSPKIKIPGRNHNHQIPFSNFRVTKEKNFVLLNQLNTNSATQIASDKSILKQILSFPQNSTGEQLKLRNPKQLISNNQPCLGTYEPNIALIQQKHSSIIPYSVSSPKNSPKNSMSTFQAQIANTEHKRSRSYTKQSILLSQNPGNNDLIKKEDQGSGGTTRTRRQGSQGGQQIFSTNLPNIPLSKVFEERAKIKTMIMDIKTNIYKMDKY